MKKFLIIGNKNGVTYKEVFPHFKESNMVLGNTIPNQFIGTDGTVTDKLQGLCRWFTNLFKTALEPLSLTKQYNPSDYPKYDNYNAINVDRVKDIPYDYDGTIGVPITILQYLNSDGTIDKKFKIVGELNNGKDSYLDYTKPFVNGKRKYSRILIAPVS